MEGTARKTETSRPCDENADYLRVVSCQLLIQECPEQTMIWDFCEPDHGTGFSVFDEKNMTVLNQKNSRRC